jgi:hypothetical protein
MADSKCQREAEIWIRNQWLPKEFGQQFLKKKLLLRSGGKFEFDGISQDGRVAVSISASCGVTSGGKKATPKLHKMRSDALFLLLLENVERRVLVFSDHLMFGLCHAEIDCGRFPREVEIMLAPLPTELESALVLARRAAAQEVTPSGSLPS